MIMMKNESSALEYCPRPCVVAPMHLVSLLTYSSNKILFLICLKIAQTFDYFSDFSSEAKGDQLKRLVIAKNHHFIDHKSVSFWK